MPFDATQIAATRPNDSLVPPRAEVMPSSVLRSRSTISADGGTRDTHWKS